MIAENKNSPLLVESSRPFTIRWNQYRELVNTIDNLRSDLARIEYKNSELREDRKILLNEIAQLKDAACAWCGH